MPAGARLLMVLGAMLLLIGGALAWQRYHPPSPMIAAAGLAGDDAADAGRRCGPMYRLTSWGRLPLRRGSCSPGGRAGPPALHTGERIGYDVLTRRVTHVHRMWEAAESVRWARAQDSVASALERRGAVRVRCRAIHPVLRHIRAKAIWRLPGYDVRLVAYSFSGDDGPAWALQVDAFRGAAPECGGRSPFR